MADIQLPDGSFVRLPDYALESTQHKMLLAMEAQLGKNSKALKKYSELVENAVESAKDARKHQKFQIKNSKSSLKILKDLLEETAKSNRALQVAMAAGRDLGSSFKQIGKLGLAAITAAGAISRLAKESVMGFGSMLTELTQQGVGLTDVRGSAMGLIANLQQLGFSTTEAAGTMATFGRVVQTAGKREFAGLQQEFAQATKFGSQFGMTMAEASEILNEDLELRQRLGILQSLDHHRQAQMSRDLFEMQMQSAAVLGRSIDEIRKLSMDVMDDPIAAITAQQIGAIHGTEAMNEFTHGIQRTTSELAGMGLDDSLVTAIMEQAQAFAPFADQAGQELIQALGAAGAPGQKLADDILNMQELTARARAGDAVALSQIDSARARLVRGVQGLGDLAEDDLQNVMNLIGATNNQFLISIAAASRQIPQAMKNLDAASRAQVDGIMEGAAAFRQAFATVRGLVQSGFATVVAGFADPMKNIAEVFNEGGKGVKSVFQTIVDASQEINAALRSMLGRFFPLDATTEDLRKRLNGLVDQLKDTVIVYIERFGEYLEEIGGPGALFEKMVSAVTSVVGAITNMVKFFENINWKTVLLAVVLFPFAKALIAGLAKVFVGPAIAKAVSGGLSALLAKVGLGTAGAAAAGAGAKATTAAAGTVAATTAGKAAAAGGGVAKTGMLTKAARGLMLFANPLVLKGIGIIGAGILILGAAVAGATWIMGKALPTFAEGLQSFGEIDGKNLMNVAGGVIALSAALAAMGAGSAIGAIGNTVANLWDGLSSLFGGKSQMDKLREFGELQIDTQGVKRNSEAAVAFGKAMASMGTGSGLGALGTIGRAIADGITSFWTRGIDPYADLIRFGNLDLNHEGTVNNAQTVVAFTEAMSVLSTVAGAGAWKNLFGNMADAITGLFGGRTPWDKLEEFGNLKLNEGIVDNANMLKTYSEAMKVFTGQEINTAELGNTTEHLSRLATIYERFSRLNSSRISNSVAAIRDLNNALVMGREQPAPDTAAVQRTDSTDPTQERALQNLLDNTSDEGIRLLAEALLESNRTTHRLLRELNTSVQNM